MSLTSDLGPFSQKELADLRVSPDLVTSRWLLTLDERVTREYAQERHEIWLEETTIAFDTMCSALKWIKNDLKYKAPGVVDPNVRDKIIAACELGLKLYPDERLPAGTDYAKETP